MKMTLNTSLYEQIMEKKEKNVPPKLNMYSLSFDPTPMDSRVEVS